MSSASMRGKIAIGAASVHRISVSASGDRWKCKGTEALLVGQPNRFAITACQRFGFALIAAPIDRAYRMDDVFRCQSPAGGDDRLSRPVSVRSCSRSVGIRRESQGLPRDEWRRRTPPPPSSEEFAAFTIASVVSSVMSAGPWISIVLPRSSRSRIVTHDSIEGHFNPSEY